MKKFTKIQSGKTWIIISAIVISSVAFIGFYEKDFEIAKNLDIFYTLFREVNLYYVDETDPGSLIKNGINGMLRGLDPYTNYIPESKIEDLRFIHTGQYGGIGALIKKKGPKATVSEAYENSPAHKAGLKAGDLIIEIDGHNIADKSIADLSDFLKGQPNTEVELLIERPGTEGTTIFTLVREKIDMKSVPHYQMLDDEIGYVRLTSFTQKAFTEVNAAVVDLKENQNMKSLVFDLRGNPGGLLFEAVKIMNLFVDKGQEIVSTKGKRKSFDKTYNTPKPAYDTIMPIAVLVNSKSASASEIVSGTMQDLDRGVIVGTRTFGKGLVQATRDLSYNTKLKVTTAKYYIPSGRCIQALDYSHRNKDGSVGHVPDSLISEFSTKNGRKVYDGGGIVPDVKTDNEQLSKLASLLYIKDIIFDFVTGYCLTHDSVPPAQEFIFSEKDYDDFVEFIMKRDFDYNTNSEELFKELIKIADEEKYYDKAKPEFDALEKILTHDLARDLQIFKEEITDIIAGEILQRYYFRQGSLEYDLKKDKMVNKAIEILKDKEEYKTILQTKM
ncbi:MAG: S41 family peptidase [Bacteroidota bacterium]|nr:S41 family peptidase [Bacteroidota bacterium]